jgi:hemolysin III
MSTRAGAPSAPLVKPRLRGVSHLVAAALAALAGAWLLLQPLVPRARVGGLVYAFSLVVLFGVSALYHVPTWPPRRRAILRRLDHSAIFVLIAGSYVPFMLRLPIRDATIVLSIVWTCALGGVLVSIFWIHAPRGVVVALCVALGCVVVPWLPQLRAATTTTQLALILGGAVTYTIGGVVYARRWPNPHPPTFGYHEVFHALTIVAATMHFVAIVVALRGVR